ncbi:MAG: divergent polysaccharide deacetylase family protein, partial [Pseudomonadota bacterium]
MDARYGAAEGVLGAVAIMLVLWMLWPEANGPQLDQRASWQESVDEVERQRIAREAERASTRTAETEPANTKSSLSYDDNQSSAGGESAAESDRRRIARPSELADRLDEFGRRPGQLTGGDVFQPGPKRPSTSDDPAIDAEILLQAEAAGEHASEPQSGKVRAALANVLGGSQSDQLIDTDAVASIPKANQKDVGEPSLEVAASSDQALTIEPLPKIDLSDLDALVPEEDAGDETVSLSVAAVDTTIPELAAITPSPDAAIAPLIVEPELTAPLTAVEDRPRDDAPSWLKNAVAAAVDDERPIIAVVIDDLGLNRANTAELNSLPSPLTLAFLPYAGRIEAQTEAAQAAGHELMLHLPMEPIGSDWPGPDALTTKLDQDEFVSRLQKNLGRFEGFVGINNHMGSRLTADDSRMDVVMRELRKRDVLFLDSKTSPRSIAGETAGRNGVPNTTRDVFLDHVVDPGAIKRQLALTERIARQSGSAVAIGHPHSTTIEAL